MLGLYTAVLTLLLLSIRHIGTVIAHPNNPPSFHPANYPQDSVITRDVIVIGGGSSGVYTAIRAKDSKKSVVLVEKKGRLGGHTETYTDPVTGLSVNYGVVLWHDLEVVRNYFARLNVTLKKINLGELANGSPSRYVDFRTGKDVSGLPGDVAAGFAAYAAQLAKYPALDAGYFLPDPVPADLLLPFRDFVEKYPAIRPAVYSLFLFIQGLGDFLRLPTLYIFKNWGLDILRNVQMGWLVPASGDNSELYRNAGVVLGPDVLLDSFVVATQRKAGQKYVKVVVKTPSGLKLLRAKKLVIAIPPLPRNLQGFDLANEERALFERFSSKYYYAGVLRNTSIPPTAEIQNARADTPYNVPTFPTIYGFSPTRIPGLINVKYGSDNELSDAEAKANILAAVERLQELGTINQTSKPEFVVFSNHSPFELNVPARDIQEGFYKKLYALQGKRETYYTGAAFHTHDSSLLWNYTEAYVIPGVTA